MESFNIFCIFQLLGGLAFFLYGMHIMSESLEKIAGGKLEKILKSITSNPLKGLLLGIGVTAVIQSSSEKQVLCGYLFQLYPDPALRLCNRHGHLLCQVHSG